MDEIKDLPSFLNYLPYLRLNATLDLTPSLADWSESSELGHCTELIHDKNAQKCVVLFH